MHQFQRSTALPSQPLRRGLLVATGAAVLVSLGGCVIAPLGSHYDPYRSVEGPTVDAAPPPPRVEVVPVAPAIGYVWIGGHWLWHLGRHAWIGGRWAAPPRGHGWAPGHWGRHGHGWRWRGGYWRRD